MSALTSRPRWLCIESWRVHDLTLRLATCKPSEVDVVMVDRGLVERTVEPLIKLSMERVVSREVKALDYLAVVIGVGK